MAESKSNEDYKTGVLEELMKQHVNLSDEQLSNAFGVDITLVQNIRSNLHRATIDGVDVPLTWDYVLAFNVGDEEVFIKPKKKDLSRRQGSSDDEDWENGMPQPKYNGQIFREIQKRLEYARLSVKSFRSNDEKVMFLVVGITESNLKEWADDRDTDLLIDPHGAVLAGRDLSFPLAQRTRLNENETDENGFTIGIENWQSMYAQYNPRADPSIFKTYPRIPEDPNTISTIFDEKTRLRIMFEAIIADSNEGGAEIKIEDYLFNKKHPLMAIFPLHDQAMVEELAKEWIVGNPKLYFWCPLDKIRAYFGEPVGFYFAFLQFYLRWLLAPAIIGLIFFIIQLIVGEIDAPGVYLCAFFIIFWSVAFVDFWAREESRLRLRWGMTKFEQKAVARPQFHGEWEHDTVTGLWSEQFSFFKRVFRMSLIFTGVSLFLIICVFFVIYVLLLKDGDPEDILLKIGLGVLNGFMIFVFDVIYKKLSTYGNEWENHRTQQDYENALILKSFFFKFFNSFSSLFYLGFIRPGVNGDGYYLRFYSAIYDSDDCQCSDDTVIDAYCSDDSEYSDGYSALGYTSYTDCTNSINSDDIPNNGWLVCLNGYTAESTTYSALCDSTDTQIAINETVLGELQIQLASLFGSMIIIQNTLEVGIPFLVDYIKDRLREKKDLKAGGVILERSEPEEQMDFGAYHNTIDDMAELLVQFGYVTLFVMALPITPLLAVLNNIFEMKVDGYNLIRQSQRPFPNGSFGLGAWNSVLAFFSIVAVGTNVALITWRTQLVTEILDDSSEKKWIFFSILSIVLALIVAIEKSIIPDVPMEVELAVERQKLIENVLVLGARMDPDNEKPPTVDDGEFEFDPQAEVVNVSDLPRIPPKSLHTGGEYNDEQGDLEVVSGSAGAVLSDTEDGKTTNA